MTADAARMHTLYADAEVAESAGDYMRAEHIMRQAIDFAADPVDAWTRLAKLQARTGNARGCIDSLAHAAAIQPDKKLFLNLSRLEAGEANWEAADGWLAKVETFDPTGTRTPCQRASLAMEFGRYRDAAMHYRRAWDRAPRDLGILQSLTYVVGLTDPGAAAALVAEFLAQSDLPLGERVMALKLLVNHKRNESRRKGRPDSSVAADMAAWQRLAQTWVEQDQDSFNALQMAAQTLIATGSALKAEPYFARLRAMGKNEPATVAYLDPAFHARLETMPAAQLPPVIAVRESDLTPRRIIMAGCDLAYAKKYAGTLLGSFAAHREPETRFHLHLFDADEAEAADFARRLDALGIEHLTISREWSGRREAHSSAPASPAARCYYHAVRYIRFQRLLEQHPSVPGFIVDADMIFNRSPAELFDLLSGHDVVATIDFGLEVQNQVAAWAVLVAPTAGGATYLRRVAAYLASCFAEDRLPWGVDQTALFCVAAVMKSNGMLDLAALPRNFLDSEFNNDAILWVAKCSPEHPAYDRYRAAVARFRLEGGE